MLQEAKTSMPAMHVGLAKGNAGLVCCEIVSPARQCTTHTGGFSYSSRGLETFPQSLDWLKMSLVVILRLPPCKDRQRALISDSQFFMSFHVLTFILFIQSVFNLLARNHVNHFTIAQASW